MYEELYIYYNKININKLAKQKVDNDDLILSWQKKCEA